MSIEQDYEVLVVLLMAVLALVLVARYFRLPAAAALILGGLALAFIPTLPVVTFDPDLVMVVFLPPLLLSSAYQTVWLDFKQYFAAITSLAVGAVVFTTLSTACVVHWIRPDLPWSTAFTLGAVVSPPDAVAVKAVLDRLNLPNRVSTVLTGESLINDASGLVLFHFALTSAISGTFSLPEAIGSFLHIAIGGIAFGFGFGWIALNLLRRFGNSELIVTGTLLLATVSYMLSDRLGFSGVLATVTTGLMLGWQQHEIYSAPTRMRAEAFWRVLVFLLESLLFVLIGLALRQALTGFASVADGLHRLALPVAGVVLSVIGARFVWLVGSDLCLSVLQRFGVSSKERPSLPMTIIVSWAGMRGVVTLTAALSLPLTFPGRNLVLASAFGVILVTVLVQATTLPLLISLFPSISRQSKSELGREEALVRRKIAAKQRKAFAAYAAKLSAARTAAPGDGQVQARLAAISAGRREMLRLYRRGQISDSIMEHIEEDLDLQEIAVRRQLDDAASKGGP
ncbi:cation:proton antiporter [Martelella alba]|nr:sodium:proton antiporter [Martelella alba]